MYNVVFWRVFTRVSATAAKSLTTNSGKSYQTARPIGTKFGTHVHIHNGNVYAPNNLPLETQEGHLGESTIQKSGKLSDWHQLWFTSADSSGNGHRLNTSRPSIPQVAFRGRGDRVSQIPKCGEAVNRLDRLAPNLAHICRSIWEWIYTEQIAPRHTMGALGGGGGVRGKTFKSLGKLAVIKRLDWLGKCAKDSKFLLAF